MYLGRKKKGKSHRMETLKSTKQAEGGKAVDGRFYIVQRRQKKVKASPKVKLCRLSKF